MHYEIKIHPLNAKGKYYVDQNSCTCSAACEITAPNNFKLAKDNYDSLDFGAYVIKQPETLEEERQCQEAIRCCPVEAIHDDGKS